LPVGVVVSALGVIIALLSRTPLVAILLTGLALAGSAAMPRRWMISPKIRLPQIPNKSTIAQVGLVQGDRDNQFIFSEILDGS
jgi:hypothetical protein